MRRHGSTATSSARSPSRIRNRAVSSLCSVRSRRTAPSSSAPPPIRACSSAKAAPWCSLPSTISPRASTLPISTSTADDFLVLQNAGPKSGYAMPEAGYLPIPAKLARAGVKDMVRISDARMSGTAYGTIVLHVSPEAAIGGPLALVQNGDRIRLSVAQRRLDLLVERDELAKRRAAHRPSRRRRSAATRGSTCRACCRPKPAATSIFCGRRRCSRSIEPLRGRGHNRPALLAP